MIKQLNLTLIFFVWIDNNKKSSELWIEVTVINSWHSIIKSERWNKVTLYLCKTLIYLSSCSEIHSAHIRVDEKRIILEENKNTTTVLNCYFCRSVIETTNFLVWGVKFKISMNLSNLKCRPIEANLHIFYRKRILSNFPFTHQGIFIHTYTWINYVLYIGSVLFVILFSSV